MGTRTTLFLTAALCAGAALPAWHHFGTADAAEPSLHPSVVQIVNDGRAKDELRGVFDAADDTFQVCIALSAGSKLSVNLDPDDSQGPAAGGLGMELYTAFQDEIVVAGTKADKSKPEKGKVKWKNVKIDATDTYSLWIRCTSPGGFRLRIKGALKTLKTTEDSTEVLNRDAEASVDFHGQRGGAVKVKISKRGKSGFKGRLTRVEREDGSLLFDAESQDASELIADADGTFTAFFVNDGNTSGDWTAKVVAKPGKAKKRTGYLNGEDVDFVPVVKKLDPDQGVHFDTAHQITLLGRNFQEGLDARLMRKGRNDIRATSVEHVSEDEVRCTFNLDTRDTDSQNSIGTWKLQVTNAPRYADEQDGTLEHGLLTQDKSKTFRSLSSGSITLPRGIQDDAEVWFVNFLDSFQTDIEKMGLGASDPGLEKRVREAVEAYTILFLRDLFRANETTGTIKRDDAVPVCFLVIEPSTVAGLPGQDYNRIDVGGAFEAGDPQDPDAALNWGFADFDDGNTQRDNLALEYDDGNGLVRLGRGARTRALDPTLGSADPDWVQATAPLRNTGLRGSDSRYFDPGFAPANQAQADRYAEIVTQIERCSREIAALIAHHILKAMGQDDGGTGASANPTTAGNLWPTYDALFLTDGEAATLRNLAVPHRLPGKGGKLNIGYFPLNTTQEFLLPNLTTEEAYAATFKFVGGRPNATLDDLKVQTTSTLPLGLTATYDGVTGTSPLFVSQNAFYCEIAIFTVRITDEKRGGRRDFVYRINVLPNIPMLPTALQAQATTCRNQVLAN